MPSTIHLHRVLTAPPERVFRAFIDGEAKVKWLPPHGFTGKMLQNDVRVGGTYRMSFTNFTTKSSHSFGYLGWQQSLDLLALLVIPEIPDAPVK